MKRILMTAAALTLGTSALAWAPADKSADMSGGKFDAAKTELSSGKGAWSDAAGASAEKVAAWEAAGKLGDAKVQTAAFDGDKAFGKDMADAKVETASFDGAKLDEAALKWKPADEAKVQTASLDMKDLKGDETKAGTETVLASAKHEHQGMGGPLETAETYPPCDPGPGDDRCIQLYEPGVRAALAQWKATGDDQVAMGGPFEPAAADSKPADAAHDGMDHSAMGHGPVTAQADKPAAPAAGTGTKPAAPAAEPKESGTAPAAAPGAIGGPVDTRTGYPPCRPGRGDDRCIQLYERGVTGRDN